MEGLGLQGTPTTPRIPASTGRTSTQGRCLPHRRAIHHANLDHFGLSGAGSSRLSPRDRPVQAKYYLPESIVERVKAQAEKKGVSQSALVAECLAESL